MSRRSRIMPRRPSSKAKVILFVLLLCSDDPRLAWLRQSTNMQYVSLVLKKYPDDASVQAAAIRLLAVMILDGVYLSTHTSVGDAVSETLLV